MDIQVKGRRITGFPDRIGQQNDSGAEEYRFLLPRIYNGKNLAEGFAYLLYMLPSRETGYVLLDKGQEGEALILTWSVTGAMTALPGPLRLELRISGLDGLLWHSEVFAASVIKGVEADTPAYVLPSPALFRSRRTALTANGAAAPALLSLGGPAGDPFPNNEPPITIAERKIIVPSQLRNIAVQNDENSEKVRILLPRWFDGNDLSTKTILLKTVSSGGRDDIPLSPVSVTGDTVELHWMLKPPQTSYPGKLRLQLYVQGMLDGERAYKWETDAAEVNIITSLDAEPVVPTEPSMLTEFLTRVAELAGQAKASETAAAQSADAAASSAASAKGSEEAALSVRADVEEKAASAGVSAAQAAESAAAAQLSAASALSSLETVQGLKEAAAKSEADSETSAVSAEESRNQAAASAEAAAGSADRAGKAEEAVLSAAATVAADAEAAKASREAAKASQTAAAESAASAQADAITAGTAAETAEVEAGRAKAEADRAQSIAGGDFASKAEFTALSALVDTKVSAQEGKVLSSNDYTDAEKEKLAGLANYDDTALAARITAAEEKDAEQDAALAGKVDAVEGMSLSHNDYTDGEKAKLGGVEEGANRYTLPTASAETLGGVKLGKGLAVDKNGTVSVTGGGGGGMHIFAHSRTGTIHALTGEAAEGLFPLLFQATGDYAQDDTLALNGEAYAVRNMWGRLLPARAWVKGAVVSACADPVGKTLWFALSSGNTTIIEGGHAGMIDGKNYYNFPLTLQEEEPVPICDGHIWVKLTKERAAQIRRLYIDSALRVSQEDGSLVFKVVDNDETYFSVSESKPINVGLSDEREITVTDLIHPERRETANWQAGLNIGSNEIRKSRPVVYSRLNGVVDVETAYLYDGVTRTWQMISQNGQYLLTGSTGAGNRYLSVYNRDTPETYSINETLLTPQINFMFAAASPDGRYIIGIAGTYPYLYGWKREGDVWERLPEEQLDPLPGAPAYTGRIVPGYNGVLAFSPDGRHLAVLSGAKQITLYKRADAGGYHILSTIEVSLTDLKGGNCINCLRYNPSGAALYAGCGNLSFGLASSSPGTGQVVYTNRLSTQNPSYLVAFKIEGDTYTRVWGGYMFNTPGQTADGNKCSGGVTDIDFSPDGKNMVVATRGIGYAYNENSYAASYTGGKSNPLSPAISITGNRSSYVLLYRFADDGITPVMASQISVHGTTNASFSYGNSTYYYTYNVGCVSRCRYSPDGKSLACFLSARLDNTGVESSANLLGYRTSPFMLYSVSGETIIQRWQTPPAQNEVIPLASYAGLSWSADSRYLALSVLGYPSGHARIFRVERSEDGNHTATEVLDAEGKPPVKYGDGVCAEFIPGLSIQ